MSNTPSAELFKDFEIPAFETGTEVPASPAGADEIPSNSTTNTLPYLPIIATIIIIIIVAIVIKQNTKLFKKSELVIIEDEPPKPIKKEKKQQKITEKTIEIEKPKAVEIKTTKQERKNFATPTNLNKCIRLFLENTRTR